MRGPAVALGIALVVAMFASGIGADAARGDDTALLLDLHCRAERGDFMAMETHYVERFCWAHLGAHHYFPGRDVVYALRSGTGVVLSVEQQFSPPTEPGEVSPVPPRVNSTLALETSLDGVAWTRIADIDYVLYRVLPFGFFTDMRQEIHFAFDLEGEEEPFRFIRVRQPVSAMQGLSGFLDHSELLLSVRAIGAAPAPDLVPAKGVRLSCGTDIMEAFFSQHPCFYGGLNRYDAPSFFHTYPLGSARLDRVDVALIAAYWRPEDPGLGVGQTLLGMTEGDILLLGSKDGEEWSELARAPIVYGAPQEVSFALAGEEAAFLRLATDKHPGYWDHPALKRAEAYLLYSHLEIHGELAAAGLSRWVTRR